VNAFWTYFWPAFAVGLLAGGIAGSIAFRHRSRRTLALAIGVAVSIGAAALWHGPLGAADRFAAEVERGARQTLDAFEMTRVQALLHRGPLTRRVRLSGPADDFQRSELVRIIGSLPGVSSVRWSASRGGVPLIVEGAAAALLGFLLGLLLAYLIELRRRYNAQWKW
jgi:hypothetical protein